MKKILVVDDDAGARESLRMLFGKSYHLSMASSAREAMAMLQSLPVDLMLLDVIMPEKDGVTFLRELSESHPDVPVIMISASDQAKPAVESLKYGAVDFVTKPYDIHELRTLVERVLSHQRLQRKVKALESDISLHFPDEGLAGSSPAFLAALEHARRAALTDATVLIHGESGTGKELVARWIHRRSLRVDEPFVAVHCGALPETLMESELFGHEKGAFTHADRQKPGRFDLAGSGTIFFDEVAEMGAATQVKLLRVLQEREYMRLGGTRVLRTNARILAASNRDLETEMRAGRFREDLYYRLNVVPVRLPPLRERTEDIRTLALYFLASFRKTMNLQVRGFDTETLAVLESHPWPGNIRELRNVIERMAVLHGHEEQFTVTTLPRELHGTTASPNFSQPVVGLETAVDELEKSLLMNALRTCGGVQTRAAAMLGITRRVLKYKMDKFGLTEPD